MVTTGGPYTDSYSFDEACLSPVAASKNNHTVMVIVEIFLMVPCSHK